MYRYWTLRQSCSYDLDKGVEYLRALESAAFFLVLAQTRRPTIYGTAEAVPYISRACYPLRRGLFFLAGRMRTGFFFAPLFLLALKVPRRAMSLAPIGEPRPVQASHPGPAEKAP